MKMSQTEIDKFIAERGLKLLKDKLESPTCELTHEEMVELQLQLDRYGHGNSGYVTNIKNMQTLKK